MVVDRTDQEISRDIDDELRWEPELDTTDIAVKVTDRVVTLTGFVKTFEQRAAAEHAVNRVSGVRALANDLQVKVAGDSARTDPELARSAAAAIEHELPHSAHLIRIVVENGAARLEGVVDRLYQKEYAEDALRGVPGITSITNVLKVQGSPMASEIHDHIAAALKRGAQIDAERIVVSISGNAVTLTGHVRSWSEHEVAAECAWAVPGVTEVHNNITVGP